ncbi:ECF transporter S component [Facklamia hominis]|uniref:ECF transporter S component n=2 Tax=Facklamia hominis TaxID=178214 RepID=K1LVY6_9LACT|nr:ECF transporter S component [Facklamia hominis]EKB56297.1 hypothetical protein HMPREF9706_00280 [Facklamia hominis CCUG 36813]MDK7186402.1 ECF transporter S component [Facklamia hominis]
MKKDARTFTLVMVAVLIAITCVATMLVQIPIPNGSGYFNLGDAIVITSGLLFGPGVGFLVGGIGSAMADFLSAYAFYAPFTLVVKGLEGCLAGYLIHKVSNKWLASILAGALMALGYLIVDSLLYNFATASGGFLMNLFQGMVGAFVASLIYPLLVKKTNRRLN